MHRFLGNDARSALCLLALCAATAAGAAGTNMVQNGSFESPDYGDDGLYAGSGDGWTGSFLGPRIIRGNIEDNNGVLYGATPYGKQTLELAGISPTGILAKDSQSVNGFVTGKKYEIVLHAADADGCSKPVLEVALTSGDGTTYFDKKISLKVGGPYVTTIAFKALQAVFTSPVTGAMTLVLSNPIVPPTGQSPCLVSVDDVGIAPVGADAVVDGIEELPASAW